MKTFSFTYYYKGFFCLQETLSFIFVHLVITVTVCPAVTSVAPADPGRVPYLLTGLPQERAARVTACPVLLAHTVTAQDSRSIPAVPAHLASGAVGLDPPSSAHQGPRGSFLELPHPTSVNPVQGEPSAQTLAFQESPTWKESSAGPPINVPSVGVLVNIYFLNSSRRGPAALMRFVDCTPGAASEKLCRAGSYCGPQTAEPQVCPEGYICPEGSYSYDSPKQQCPFPYYCPANSSAMKSCAGGSMPVSTNGLRGSNNSSCSLCEEGTYRPHLSPSLQCLPCLPGYYCPQGTENYKSNPCPRGYVCGKGSAQPRSCPPGTFGNLTRAEKMDDCHPCPADTFNHLPAQKACFPCGSSSTSPPGSSSCTCIGKNRAFQYSDGSCLCRTGFIYYNELDFRSSASDSELDCQPEVNRRCSTGEVRVAASRECVSPSLHSCNITCGSHGGILDMEMGICLCERYVSAEEICNTSCLFRLPQLSAQLTTDGDLQLSLRERNSRVWARTVTNVLGPDIHVQTSGNVHLVQFSSEGLFGWIPIQKDLVNIFLSEPIDILNTRPRKRRQTEEEVDDDDDDDYDDTDVLPRIPNPIACLSSGDMLVFHLTINHTDRRLSHFPVYQKDHLFNSNPSWDFGAFRHLQILMKQTHFNSSMFAHVFSEAGKYVFVDSVVSQWSLVVVVSEAGTECDPRAAAFQPMTPALLVKHGIVKQHRLNLLPDWGLIAGILSLLLVLVVVLTTTVLVLRPSKAKLVPHWKIRPKWRSLGEPFCPAECVCSRESTTVQSQGGILGSRGVGEGAEAEEPAVLKGGSVSGCCDLEEFNVKTLYDKLEDQNLHVAAQLARHRKDMQEFYRNICQQAESLKVF
ncbi:uncharacterized protein LOC118566763 [Fundulus heteroclitus]|uniref:uncharacterized protein LOC118566763 n=1 Tax=Fundulus heteroclitus TaxID=8078 RepID=UPI00165A5555|nr:uncharacterized protein LOC118566763 [Fundulus heteroclitus]